MRGLNCTMRMQPLAEVQAKSGLYCVLIGQGPE